MSDEKRKAMQLTSQGPYGSTGSRHKYPHMMRHRRNEALRALSCGSPPPHCQTSEQVVRLKQKHVAQWRKVVLMVLCHAERARVCVHRAGSANRQRSFIRASGRAGPDGVPAAQVLHPAVSKERNAHTCMPIANATVTSSHKHGQDDMNVPDSKRRADKSPPLSFPPTSQPTRLNYNRDSTRRAR